VNSHKNARLTYQGRLLLIERISVMGLTRAAETAGISVRTARKWRDRYIELGQEALRDRSSRPLKTRDSLDGELSCRVEQLRRNRMPMRRIAAQVGRSVATISRALAKLGLSSLKALDEPKPVLRYEHDAPGELLHIDTKKLGRIVRPSHRVTGDRRDSVDGAGWEFAHVAIDDHSRVGFVQMRTDERKTSAVDFLKASVAHYAALGVTIKRLLTDNGSAYRSKLFAKTCENLGIKHSFTKPYCPQTNGKAERFIQTCLREWAYGRIWANSGERTAWLPAFLRYYNAQRPHSALGYKPPASRLGGYNLSKLNRAGSTWRSSWTCSAGVSWAGARAVRCIPSSCSTRWSRRCMTASPRRTAA
jgi:transposase InsO family protein